MRTGEFEFASLKMWETPMFNKILVSGLVLAAISVPTFAATTAPGFYVAQDAKTHKCMISDKKPDGKMMMDAGTKVYMSKSNAEQAMANLKACATAAAAAATPVKPVSVKPAAVKPAAVKPVAVAAAAGFYVEQDAKTHKCAVDSKKPDGKMMMDVGTKVYANKANADQAMSMLKVCK